MRRGWWLWAGAVGAVGAMLVSDPRPVAAQPMGTSSATVAGSMAGTATVAAPLPQVVTASAAIGEGIVDEPPKGPIDADPGKLEEIIVTAQKREENVQLVPASISTLDSERVAYMRSAGEDVRFLAARVPSLNIESSFGRAFPRFYIRGLGNPDFDLNASQPVLMVLDEIVLENPTLKGFPIFDIDRIETLRGPQGTLFGRNTPAGVVKIESAKPKQTMEAFGRFTYGQFNFVGFEGAANAALVDDVLAARVSLLYERRDGWVDNRFTGEENALEGFRDVAGRFQLLFTPTDRVSLLLNFHAHSLTGTARVFRANIIEQGSDRFVPGFNRTAVSQDGQNSQSLEQLGLTANFQYDLGPLTFVSILGYEKSDFYSRGDIDGGFGAVFAPPSGPGVIPFPSESADAVPKLNQFVGEVRLVSDLWAGFSFQTGVFIFREDLAIESFSYDTLAGGIQNGYAIQNQLSNAFGIYGTASYQLLDILRFSAGVRWSDDSKRFRASRTQSPIGGGAIGPLTANPEDSDASWDASATWFINEDLNIYVRAASSFRAPSIQGRILFGDSISVADSEKMLSFEGGVKSQFFGNRARVNLSGYYYDLRDQQLTAVGGTANFNTLLNADKTVGGGFEADAEFLPVAGLWITFGLSYNRTEIRDETLAIAPCGAPCTVNDPAGEVEGTVLIRGNSLPNAPRWIANVTLRYGLPIHDGGELFLFTDWSYRSRVHFFLYESVEFTDKNLLEGGLRLGYARTDGSIEASIFVRNLTNDLSLTGGIDFNNLTGFVNEPRVFGAQAVFRL